MLGIEKIVSGGQTGADRAALNVAIQHGVPHGGWCPAGRRAEDGIIPPKFHLNETPLEDYAQRTEWNVRDSDATVIFTPEEGDLKGGTALTERLARSMRRPCLRIVLSESLDENDERLPRFRSFVVEHGVKVLNVAGPRESEEPGIGAAVESFLGRALQCT